MDNDIVARLRSWEKSAYGGGLEFAADAADEITRLRAEIRQCKEILSYSHEDVDELERKAASADRLRNNVEWLEVALELIKSNEGKYLLYPDDDSSEHEDWWYKKGSNAAFDACARVAHTALEGKSDDC